MTKKHLPLLLLALAALGSLPFFLSGYWARVLTVMFMYGVIAQGINLMSGFMGYVPFGNAMFFAVGGYSTAVAMGAGIPFFLTLPVAACVSVVISVLIGLPVLRLRGHYFAVATIGVSGALMSVVQNVEFTGGAMGTTLPILNASPAQASVFFYLAMLGLLVVANVTTWLILRSRFGFGIRAIRANEDAANSMGINTTLYKVLNWSISAVLTSLAGSFYAYWMSFISPDEMFNVMIAVNAIVILLVGGLGTVLGPMAGAVIFQFVSEVAWSSFGHYHLAVLGVATIIIVALIPNGFVGRFLELRRKRITGQTEEGAR